jgi:hypothetical protein
MSLKRTLEESDNVGETSSGESSDNRLRPTSTGDNNNNNNSDNTDVNNSDHRHRHRHNKRQKMSRPNAHGSHNNQQSESVIGTVTSSGAKFAIVNNDIHVSKEMAIEFNSWPLFKGSEVKVDVISIARQAPNRNNDQRKKLLPYKAVYIEILRAAKRPHPSQGSFQPYNNRYQNDKGGRYNNNMNNGYDGDGNGSHSQMMGQHTTNPFHRRGNSNNNNNNNNNKQHPHGFRQYGSRQHEQMHDAFASKSKEYKPIDTAALLKKRKEEKRLKEEEARLAEENGVCFDYDEEEGEKEVEPTTPPFKNDEHDNTKYIFKKGASTDPITSTSKNDNEDLNNSSNSNDNNNNKSKKEFKIVDTAALLKERKEQRRKENERQLELSKKKVTVLTNQIKTYREMLKKINGKEEMELMIMKKITDTLSSLEKAQEKVKKLS